MATRRIHVLLTATLCLLSACGRGSDAPQKEALDGDADASVFAGLEKIPPLEPAPAGAPRVLVLGDSLAAGLHLPEERSFPRVLERRLRAKGIAFHLTNSGVSGDTTAGGVSRLPWLLERTKPKIAILALGSNDGLRGQDPTLVEANLRSMIGMCREAKVIPILLGVRAPGNLSEDYLERFEGIWPKLAKEYGLDFVPSFLEGVGGHPEFNLPDGIHPTPKGHEMIAARLEDTLSRVLLRESARETPNR